MERGRLRVGRSVPAFDINSRFKLLSYDSFRAEPSLVGENFHDGNVLNRKASSQVHDLEYGDIKSPIYTSERHVRVITYLTSFHQTSRMNSTLS